MMNDISLLVEAIEHKDNVLKRLHEIYDCRVGESVVEEAFHEEYNSLRRSRGSSLELCEFGGLKKVTAYYKITIDQARLATGSALHRYQGG